MGMSLVFLLVGLVVGALLRYVGSGGAGRHAGDDDACAPVAKVAGARGGTLASRQRIRPKARSQGDASVLSARRFAQLEQMTQRVSQMEVWLRARQRSTLAEQLRKVAQREAERPATATEGALRSRSARGTWV